MGLVEEWINNYSLKLNGDKTEVLVLGKNQSLCGPQHWPESLGSLPVPAPKVKNLCFVLDDKLSMKP